MKTSEPIYLSIGAPSKSTQGFVRIGPVAESDIVADPRDGLPFANASVGAIYCENYLEMLDCGEILAFFRECRRILVSEGTLRIATNDLDVIVDAYVKYASVERGSGHRWYSNRAGFLNSWYGDEGCKWLVNQEELLRLGALAGFVSPVICRAEESRDPRLEKVSQANDSTLIVEFSKRKESSPDTPLVSILIPAYKPQFFRESLLSALGQTYENIEILVLDDSPSDFIEDITRELADGDTRIRYVRNNPPLGEIENLSTGIALARGEFIKPLYDDDILFPEAIDVLLSLYREVPDAGLAAGRRNFIDVEGKELEEQPPISPLYETSGRISGTKVIAQIAEAGMNMIGEPTVILFRKSDALAIDEPNVMSLFGEECMGIGDLAMFAHLLSMGDLAYTQKTISQFRIHADQTQRRDDVVKRIPLVWEYFRESIARLGFRPHLARPPVAWPQSSGLAAKLGDPGTNTSDAPPPTRKKDIYDRESYNAWLHRRVPAANDLEALAKIASTRFSGISFHIVVRLEDRHRSLLADTLDSLNHQVFAGWQVQVATPVAAPAGMDEVRCIKWFTVAEGEEKACIDAEIAPSRDLWAIELPAGAVLDPMCLWRVAHEIAAARETVAFFVDDDIYDRNGARKKPRFKPGVNPAWLMSSDLAGPLFVRGDAWRHAGGLTATRGSPWFDQLLRISDSHGWTGISHIADVLVSYPEHYPTDVESCLLSLVGNFHRKGIAADFEPASSRSWRIRYPLSEAPRITLAVISQGQLDLLVRCVSSLIDHTLYPDYEIVLVVPELAGDAELDAWLEECSNLSGGAIRSLRCQPGTSFGQQCNLAASAATGTLLSVLSEGCVALESHWLEELVRPILQPGVAGTAPRLLAAGTGLIAQVGSVLGLNGATESPYSETASLGTMGYLDLLQVSRDITILPETGFLINLAHYRKIGGMSETAQPAFGVADLSLRLRSLGQRLLYQPTSTLVGSGYTTENIFEDAEDKCATEAKNIRAEKTFTASWLRKRRLDPYWNAHFSLADATPQLEMDYFAQWLFQPTEAPRIFARPVTNAQADFRITSYLTALRNAGMASECVWPQTGKREPSIGELLRLAPDSVVIQHYILDHQLASLRTWRDNPDCPFIVFAMDDLLTNLDTTNPFRKGHPPNNRTRLKFALERCDRLVVSTDYLADCFSHLARDIRVVPNRLEMAKWLPLRAGKRTTAKPRIGWAGGTTHLGDLALLKEVIAQTRGEADWVFFGMCPPEIRPLLAEFHELVSFAAYPARLASLNFDIAVAPLAQTPFNRAKSNLRLLEYGMLGIPVVCTDIDPYRNSPACRVENTVEAWVSALRERIHDADAREREGQEMRRWVRQGYLLENHLDEWLAAHLPS